MSNKDLLPRRSSAVTGSATAGVNLESIQDSNPFYVM